MHSNTEGLMIPTIIEGHLPVIEPQQLHLSLYGIAIEKKKKQKKKKL